MLIIIKIKIIATAGWHMWHGIALGRGSFNSSSTTNQVTNSNSNSYSYNSNSNVKCHMWHGIALGRGTWGHQKGEVGKPTVYEVPRFPLYKHMTEVGGVAHVARDRLVAGKGVGRACG